MRNFGQTTAFRVVYRVLVVVMYALLVTPFLVSSKFFFPFISTKTFYFRLLVEIALVLYILLAAADEKFRPKLTAISGAVFLYTTVIFITSLIGINFYRSFWGNTERGEGILTFLHIVAFFVVLTGIFWERRQWERYFFVSVLVSLGTCIYATLQRFGADFVLAGDLSRISATIGNASFFAGYLVSNIFIALWLAVTRRSGWQKLILWLIVIYEILILNATKTRGAILGLGLGLFVMFFLAVFTANRRKVKYWSLAGLLGILLLAGLVWTLRDTALIQSAGALQRVTEISRGDITTESRLLTWKASWQGWQDRFWQGYGYENFNIAFNKYFPAEIFRDSGSQIWFDRAHNIFFDVSVSSGVFGILTYLGIFVLSFWALYKYYRKNPQDSRSTSVIFSALLVAYFFQNLFVFDTLGTYISFYAILAFFVFLQKEPPVEKIVVEKKEKNRKAYFDLSALNPYLAISLILVFGLVSYFSVIRPVQANTQVTKALYSVAYNRFEEMIENYRKVIEMDTYVTEEARQKMAEAAITMRYSAGLSDEQTQRGFRYAVEELRQAVERAPQDARNYLFLMAAYNNFPSTDGAQKQAVLNLGRDVIELSPDRPQIYFEMGQAAHGLGRYEEAIGYFETAVAKNPAAMESHWNLALVNILSGRPEIAIEEIDYIFSQKRISKISTGNLENMATYFGQLGRYDQQVRLYEELLVREPQDNALKEKYDQVLEIISQQSIPAPQE